MADAQDENENESVAEEDNLTVVDPDDIFAIAPALMDSAVINYHTVSGSKLYRAAIQKLAEPFNVTSAGLKPFLRDIGDRARYNGWGDILAVPKDLDDPDIAGRDTTDLLTQYGCISIKQVRDHALSYYLTKSRAVEDSNQMYVCIMDTLTKEGRAKVVLHEKEYTFGNGDYVSGPVLLKVVIMESYIDTNATTRHIRQHLSQLHEYILTVDSDIEIFNLYVNGLINSLAARGQSTQDLLANLVKGYKTATDDVFVKYIEKKEEDNNHGHDIQSMRLMELARNKYKTMVEENKWKAPSEDSTKIIALQAQVKLLGNKFKAGPGPKYPSNKGPKDDKFTPKKKKGDKPPKAPWMLVAPTEGQPLKKLKDGKDWIWCPTHKSWGRHTLEKCNGLGIHNGPDAKGSEKNNALKLTQALAAVITEEDESD
jgi:hypothetical protein